MKSPLFDLPAVLDMHSVSLQDRTYTAALGVARALAYSLYLPTSEVEVPLSFFATQHLPAVNTVLSEINEHVVINIELALSLTKKLWLFRYNVVFESENPMVRAMLDLQMASGSPEIPPNASELFRRYTNQGLFTAIGDIIKRAVIGV